MTILPLPLNNDRRHRLFSSVLPFRARIVEALHVNANHMYEYQKITKSLDKESEKWKEKIRPSRANDSSELSLSSARTVFLLACKPNLNTEVVVSLSVRLISNICFGYF